MPRKKSSADIGKPNEESKSSKVRSRKPTTHAEGKPVRGVRPGVRGPNKRAEEVRREELGMDRVLVIPKVVPRNTNPVATQHLIPGPHPANPANVERSRNQKLNRQLQDLIREIGNEVVDEEKGWTRVIGVVRRLYYDAMQGKTQATALLLERGWGKVPTPIQMDMKAEVLEIMESTGLTQQEIQNDPILREIMGNTIEGSWKEPNDPTGHANPGDRSPVQPERTDAGTRQPD
jgi:hypothetical protein